jgi:peptidoglycan/xylan/chitin deacetylase (PgdA/CDA1 family)
VPAGRRSRISGWLWSLVAAAVYRLGLLRLLRPWTNRWELAPGRSPLVRRRRSRKVQILSLHRVAPGEDGYLSPLPLVAFEERMEFLARRCSVLALDQAVDALVRHDVPENAVVLTFDDGYRDNYLHAFPILEGLSLPATIFLVTGSIGTGRLIWHDRVFRAFGETRCVELTGFPADGQRHRLDDAGQREHARTALLRWLKTLDEERRDEQIARLAERLEVEDARVSDGLMLSWDEVQRMHARGIGFGAHTVSHPVLSRVSDERARQEIDASKREIEARLHCPVRAFAYPNGSQRDFSAATKRLLREAGFDCAVTTIFGTNEPAAEPPLDLLELRRMGLVEASLPAFAAKLDLYRFVAHPSDGSRVR